MNTAVTLSLLWLGTAQPADFTPTATMQVEVDKKNATLTRSMRRNGSNAHLGGEHISSITRDDGRLLGYVRMTADMAAPAPLPSKDEAHDIAMQVLSKHAPDLLDAHKVHWIAPHDETIRVLKDGKEQSLTLTGMKVKMRATNKDKLWFWVIVGPQKQVMVFERDIYWRTIPGNRRTEKWLHDNWLAERPEAQQKMQLASPANK
ncbi:hypothetical protein [Polycladidibacter stylochi]|uniref:hypothetical protein n=1 Tax=Polycladidibacter stylochi TaxID=1807766 RepID=UPI000AC5B096|nr:hypothetical protein [Pseudovibrio stylochi]